MLTADDEERERFYQEARAASQILHPNVTAIFEINESGGQIYLSMGYVDGTTLTRRIQQDNPLSLGRALDVAIHICNGISAAHEKSVVHRDIKSENILITAKGDVKITDFGLAKLKGVPKFTKAGSTLGTAAYMSPEQARGEDVDARSDIFSCGVVLYELFTGKLPFRGDHQAAILYSLVKLEGGPDALYALAQIYALTGEPDASMDKLEQILGIPNVYTAYFCQYDTELASLASVPRFQKLLEKYKGAL